MKDTRAIYCKEYVQEKNRPAALTAKHHLSPWNLDGILESTPFTIRLVYHKSFELDTVATAQ